MYVKDRIDRRIDRKAKMYYWLDKTILATMLTVGLVAILLTNGFVTVDFTSSKDTSIKMTVVGNSMSPRFKDGEVLSVIKSYDGYSKGSIVLFDKDGINYVKRIKGVKGDFVEYISDDLFINDVLVCSKCLTTSGVSAMDSSYVIPDGKMFVLGDNLDESVDSRKFGLIDTKMTLGSVERDYGIPVCDYDEKA